MPENDEKAAESPEDGEQKEVEQEQRSYVLIQFKGPGSSGFMLTVHNVDPWQLSGAAAELTDRAREGRQMNRHRRMKETAQRNAEVLNARKRKRKTDD